MFGINRGPRPPLCRPLRQAPPGPKPCAPVLLLGLPSWITTKLGHVLRNDLVFSTNSQWPWPMDAGLKLAILEFLDGDSLLKLTKAVGGSVIANEEQVWSEEQEFNYNSLLQKVQRYQAIVLDDTTMYNDERARAFVMEQYQQNDVSVVVMGVEGIYNLAVLRDAFQVNWRTRAYTKENVKMTEAGKQIVGSDAFPCEYKYTKALFVEGDGELFTEHINPADYEDSDDPVPDPQPGSPVVCRVDGDRSVAYFGFVNSLDVSYGAIILQLCYASYHHAD